MNVRHPKESYAPDAPASYDDCLRQGEEIFQKAMKERGGPTTADQRQGFNSEASELRWFLLPSEAKDLIRGVAPSKVEMPFSPRQYSTNGHEYRPQDYSTIPAASYLPKSSTEEVKSNDEIDTEDGDDEEESNGFLIDSTSFIELSDEEDSRVSVVDVVPKKDTSLRLWKSPVKSIMKPTLEAILRYKMINNGDRVLVCVSGGKDSLTLLHTIRQYQQQSKRFGITFELGAMTVDPGSTSYDPSPLIPYMEQLGIPYFYERQCTEH